MVVRWTTRAAVVLMLCWTLLVSRQPVRAANGDGTVAAAARRIVAYFPTYARDDGYSERSIDFSVVTVVAHWSLTPRADGSLALPAHFPDPALVTATHAAGATIVLVVGDDQASTAQAFSTIVASASLRRTLVANLLRIVRENGYDGVDVDWEYPNSRADDVGLTALAGELRAALGPSRTLSLAAAPGDWGAHYFDVAALSDLLNWFGLMTYQYAGPAWSQSAQHNAPLFSTAQQPASIEATVAYFRAQGAPAAKLLIGLAFFGERYDGATALDAPLASSAGGDIAYSAIAQLLPAQWTAQRDAAAGVPYLLRSDGAPGVISYDDAQSIAAKCAYAAAGGLGGAIVWRLGQDGSGPPATQPLLQAARACR
jgi:chitinase